MIWNRTQIRTKVRFVSGACIIESIPILYFGGPVFGVYCREERVDVIWFNRFVERSFKQSDFAKAEFDGAGQVLFLNDGSRVNLRRLSLTKFAELAHHLTYRKMMADSKGDGSELLSL